MRFDTWSPVLAMTASPIQEYIWAAENWLVCQELDRRWIAERQTWPPPWRRVRVGRES